MHEQSLAMALVRTVERLAADANARRVVAVDVRVPALPPLSEERLRTGYALAAAGTVTDGARVTIRAAADAGEVMVEQIEIDEEED